MWGGSAAPNRLLIVEDETSCRELLQSFAQGLGHACVTAQSGAEALAKLTPEFDLVLLSVAMPDIDGFLATRHIRADPRYVDLPILMMLTLGAKEDRLRAVEAGANDFITKPIDLTEFRIRTASLLKMKAAQDAFERHQAELEASVMARTAALCQALEEVANAQQNLSKAHLDTVHRLAVAAEYRDDHTAAHIQRVGHYCALLARGLGLPARDVECILHASPMHDVGKIGVPDAILLKPGALTPEEREIVNHHTIMGARILGGSVSELLQVGEVIALSHHERWDGAGYPNGLAGDTIPLYGRICAVADVFDALTSKRPYKEPFTNEKTYEILREGRGTHFDPQILDLFFVHLPEVCAIQKRFSDL